MALTYFNIDWYLIKIYFFRFQIFLEKLPSLNDNIHRYVWNVWEQRYALESVCVLGEERISVKEFLHVMCLQVEIYQRK